MTSSRAHSDVLVVGAGPVGMTVAILLAARGVGVTVIEKNAGTANDPKAISLDDESLRVYQQAGIEDLVLDVIVPGTGTKYYDADNLELFHGQAAVPYRSGYPFKNPFAQPDLERVLSAALVAHPLVDLHFATELVDFTDADGAVTAIVKSDGVTRDITFGYVLGADGGRSLVRSTLGVGMTGRSHDEVWLVVDCLDDTRRERYGMHHGDPARPHVIVPGLRGRCRYEFYTFPGECDASEAPSFELIEGLLAPYRSITPAQVERAVAYKFHGLNADSWRVGRAFLLGDAAHMMPPFAGQGLNSGIRDAANLAWKLSEVLGGRASDRLLDSYEAERRPHAEAVIRSSEKLGRVVMTRNERLARYRDTVIRDALLTPDGRDYFEHMRYRPSTRYLTGAVFEPQSHPLVGCQVGQPLVFAFASHERVPLDQLLGNDWALLGVGVTEADWHSALGTISPGFVAQFVDVPLDDTVHEFGEPIGVAIDLDTRLYEEFGSARGCFVLLRPDRFVAAVVDPSRLSDLSDQFIAGITTVAPVTSLQQ